MMMYFLYLKVVLISANSADTGEMQHDAALYLGLRCLLMYPCIGFLYTKGLK